MDTDWVGQGLEVVYHKGRFCLLYQSLLMTDKGVLCEISKLDDDTKIASRVNILDQCKGL